MKNITILVQSFFSQKKNQSCKKKVFGYTTFHLAKKKILDSCVRSIFNKTFFSEFGKKKKLTASDLMFPNTFSDCSFKKTPASELLMFSNTFLVTAVSKK